MCSSHIIKQTLKFTAYRYMCDVHASTKSPLQVTQTYIKIYRVLCILIFLRYFRVHWQYRAVSLHNAHSRLPGSITSHSFIKNFQASKTYSINQEKVPGPSHFFQSPCSEIIWPKWFKLNPEACVKYLLASRSCHIIAHLYNWNWWMT